MSKALRLYHATRALEAVLADGWVRPMRMPNVYAFTTREAAESYAAEFGYDAVVEIEVDSGTVVARWRPSYAAGGTVVMIRGAARVVPA